MRVRGTELFWSTFHKAIEHLLLPLDKADVRRTNNLDLVPPRKYRRGGKIAYGEWCHVIGVFQTLLLLHGNAGSAVRVLDIGCGTGLVGLSAMPIVLGGGSYLGLDVDQSAVDFCRSHYPAALFRFEHVAAFNAQYAPEQTGSIQWPVETTSVDMVTAVSVWTHLSESDARQGFNEISRVLKPGGRAIITCFLLDETYERSLAGRRPGPGRFHRTPASSWIFDTPDGDDWRHPRRLSIAEGAIGFTPHGLATLMDESGLKLVVHHLGNWKEVPGIYFQDILVLTKPEK